MSMLLPIEEEGFAAYNAGVPMRENPYPVPNGGIGIYVQWARGWSYARECNEGDWFFPTDRKQPNTDTPSRSLTVRSTKP